MFNKLFNKNKSKASFNTEKHKNPIEYSQAHSKPKHIIAVDEYYSMAVDSLEKANDSIEVLKIVMNLRFETQKGSQGEKSGGVAGISYRDASTMDIIYRNKTTALFEKNPKVVAAFEDADINFEKWDYTIQTSFKSIITSYRESNIHQKAASAISDSEMANDSLIKSIDLDTKSLNKETVPILFFKTFDRLSTNLDEISKRDNDPLANEKTVELKDDMIRSLIDRCYADTIPKHNNAALKIVADGGIRRFNDIIVHGEHFMSDSIKDYYKNKQAMIGKTSGANDNSITEEQRLRNKIAEKQQKLDEMNSLDPTLEAAKESADIINTTVDPVAFLENVISLIKNFSILIELYKKMTLTTSSTTKT